MQRVNKHISKRLSATARLSMAALAVTLASSAMAATMNYDTSSSTGYQTGSGTWDFDTTADWSASGTTLVPWSSDTDTAVFNLASASNGGVLTVNDSTNGPVGAGQLIFTGSTGSATATWQLGGGTLQLGSGGIRHTLTNGVLTIAAPLQLTASQTWTNNKSAANVLLISGPISSLSGQTTNLTLDGLSAGTGAGDAVTFNFSGSNTFSGSTTVTGSATLKLDYTTNNTAKLDPNSPLILNNGKIYINGGTYSESVASTSLGAGNNFIDNSAATTSTLALGTVTRSQGATLSVGSSRVGFVTLANANTDGSMTGGTAHILGGWATCYGGEGWLDSNGTSTGVGSTNGSAFTTTTGWLATSNVKFTTTGSSSITANTSANVLQLSGGSTGAVTLNIQSGCTLTLASGGLMNSTSYSTTTSSINGGMITTGMSTGELFVYAPYAFNISSQIVDNGTTPTVLVKGAANTLTLSGANTYTGKTYVNGGTLALTGSAIGTVTGGLAVATNATFNPGGTYTVGSGKTLSGGGTITNSVDASGATINPGDSIGTLNIQGGLTLDANSRLNFDIDDLSSGAANDKIVLATASSRPLTLNGTLYINNMGGLAVGEYTLISGATSITDNGLTLAPNQGFTGTISDDGNNVYLTVSAIPEPATMSLLLGAVSLGLLARRSRRPEQNA